MLSRRVSGFLLPAKLVKLPERLGISLACFIVAFRVNHTFLCRYSI